MSKKWMVIIAVVAVIIAGQIIKIDGEPVWVVLWNRIRGEQEEVEE